MIMVMIGEKMILEKKNLKKKDKMMMGVIMKMETEIIIKMTKMIKVIKNQKQIMMTAVLTQVKMTLTLILILEIAMTIQIIRTIRKTKVVKAVKHIVKLHNNQLKQEKKKKNRYRWIFLICLM